MDTPSQPVDPLDQEIASTEEAIRNSAMEIAEIESRLAEKRLDREKLAMEVRIMKRAAELRPAGAGRYG
jgi:hypothetical protein